MNLKRILFIVVLLTLGCTFAFADELNGTYQMELKIGERVFNDELVLESLSGAKIDHFFFNSQIKGSITVPGVFTAPLVGRGQCNNDVHLGSFVATKKNDL